MKTLKILALFLLIGFSASGQDDVRIESDNPRVIAKMDNNYGGFYFQKSGSIQGGLVYNHLDSTMRWSHTSAPQNFLGLTMKTKGDFSGHIGLGTSPTKHFMTLVHNSIRVGGVVNHPNNTAHLALVEDDANDFARIWFLNSAYDDRWAVLARHGDESKLAIAYNGENKFSVDPDGYATFNKVYTLPNVDGNQNEFLQTDGSGNVSWAPVNTNTLSDADGDTRITLEEALDIDQINLYCKDDLMINMKEDTMYIPQGVFSGFGTTNPLDPIHITAEANDEYAGIYLEGGSGTKHVHCILDNRTANGKRYSLVSVGDDSSIPNGSFAIRDIEPGNGKELLLIDPDGNVGIDENFPQRKLHVNGSAIIEGAAKVLDSLEVGVGLGAKIYIGNDFITDGGPDLLRFDANLVPNEQTGFDVGGNVLRWRDLFLADTAFIATSELFERGTEILVTNSHFMPEFNGLKDLGGSDIAWRDLWIDRSIRVGSTTIRLNSANTALTIDNNFLPSQDNTFQIGTGARRWKSIFAVSGVVQTSDARAKEQVENLEYGLKEVLELRPVDFHWKKESNSKKTLGLIAQELLRVIPEVVVEPTDAEELLGVKYAELVPVLIKAIQEQNAEIVSLQNQLAQGTILEAEVEKLKATVEVLVQQINN